LWKRQKQRPAPRSNILKHVAEQIRLRRVDLDLLPGVGADPAARNLLQAEQFYQRVRGSDFAGLHLGDQIPFQRR